MKFYTIFLAIITITSVFSYSVVGKNFKRDVKININQNAFSDLPEQCSNDLKKIQENYDCVGLTKLTRENFKSLCNVFNSEECQKVLEDPISHIPNCKNSSLVNEIFSETAIEMRKVEMKIICNSDEEGSLCPVAEIFIEHNRNHTEAKKAIRRSCISKKCNEIMIDSLPVLLNETKQVESFASTEGEIDQDIDENVNNWVEYLKSKECTKQYSINDATSLRIGSTFILTLGLILSFF
jgi:hypothetical protein